MEAAELIVEIPTVTEVQPDVTPNSAPAKKTFVAPEIAVPVDVLETTTFFQALTSGATP